MAISWSARLSRSTLISRRLWRACGRGRSDARSAPARERTCHPVWQAAETAARDELVPDGAFLEQSGRARVGGDRCHAVRTDLAPQADPPLRVQELERRAQREVV